MRTRHHVLHQRGYSLLETLAALVLFGMALLIAANALTAQATMAKRLEVRRVLLRSAEAVLEGVRGGLVPLSSGPVDPGEEFDAENGTPVETFIDVVALEPAGLYEVRVRSSAYTTGGAVNIKLQTMVWRP